MESLFLGVLNAGVTASYVILAVLLARLCLRRAPKAVSYALWSVVAFRLACPVSFPSVFSIFNLKLFNMAAAQRGGGNALTYVPYDVGMAAAPRVTVGIPVVNAAIGGGLPAADGAGANPAQAVLTVAAVLWAAGFLAMMLYGAASWLRVRRLVANAVWLEGNVYGCDRIPSPFVLGLFRPRIYIPFGLDETERAYVLAHERLHIRRLDHAVKPLSYLLLCAHWFNPLVWLAYRCMCLDMEMRCDESVLGREGPAAKAGYGRLLLSLAARRHVSAGLPAFGEPHAKSRIRNVLRFKRAGTPLVAAALLLGAAVLLACGANPVKGDHPGEDGVTYYAFDENLYTNPLSSFCPVKGQMPVYAVTPGALRIIDAVAGTDQAYPAAFDDVEVDREAFGTLFDIVLPSVAPPDLSGYGACRQWAAAANGDGSEYRLYRMDGEVWLATLTNGKIWSLYRLAPTDAPERTPGGAETASAGPGYTLEIRFNGEVMESVSLRDGAAVRAAGEVIEEYTLSSLRNPPLDEKSLGDSIRLYAPDGGEAYVAFMNEAVADGPQLQTDEGRAPLSPQRYESLWALWESHMALPDAVTVVSGDALVEAKVFRGGELTDGSLAERAEGLAFLPIDGGWPQGDIVPFHVYAGGEELFGSYRLFDAATMEEIEVMQPSGVSPQTWIFRSAKPGHKVIVELATGYGVGRGYGMKVLFGAVP